MTTVVDWNQPGKEVSGDATSWSATARDVQLIRSELRAGAVFAAHSHVNEQVTFVLEGCLEVTMNGIAHRVEPGMILRIPSSVPHAARVCSDTPAVIVEAFSPPRDDLRNLSVE